jgi:hypothetical protein
VRSPGSISGWTRETEGFTGAAYLSSELLDALKDLGTARTGEVSREYLRMDPVEGGVHRSCLPKQ